MELSESELVPISLVGEICEKSSRERTGLGRDWGTF